MEHGPFDIPDYDHIEDESFPPLPPPPSPGQGGGEEADPFANGEEEGELSKLADVPAAKRKFTKKPQPKLDSQRLTSARGLPALRTLFDDVRFKGKGHEAEDLRLLMQKMENWAHRLYPKLQFEDFIDKLEKLGAKKDVQTCLKRIRLDMPMLHEDFIGNDGEEEAAPEAHIFPEPEPFGGDGFPEFPEPPLHSTPAPPPAPSMTEEQRKRMELNRQLALERRLARKQQQTDPSDSQPISADQPSTSSSSQSLREDQERGSSADHQDRGSSADHQEREISGEHSDSPPCEKGETRPHGNGCEDSQ